MHGLHLMAASRLTDDCMVHTAVEFVTFASKGMRPLGEELCAPKMLIELYYGRSLKASKSGSPLNRLEGHASIHTHPSHIYGIKSLVWDIRHGTHDQAVHMALAH